MPSIKVAHVREQAQNMLLSPLDGAFGQKTSNEQHAILAELEGRAHDAGLAGRAAVFWQRGGRTYSIGPQQLRNFLRSMDMRTVLASVNKSISW